jgi:hypothetical protein
MLEKKPVSWGLIHTVGPAIASRRSATGESFTDECGRGDATEQGGTLLCSGSILDST